MLLMMTGSLVPVRNFNELRTSLHAVNEHNACRDANQVCYICSTKRPVVYYINM